MNIAIDVSNLHKLSQKRGIGFYTENLISSLKKYTDVNVLVIEDESEYENIKVDLVHYPYFDFFRTTLPIRKKYPTVITIHDVIPLKFSEHYPPGIHGKVKSLIQNYSLKNVNAVITDSHSSKKDIRDILKIPESKIFSVYLAASEHFKKVEDAKKLENVKVNYNLPDNFALYVGSTNWNKNLNNLAKGCMDAGIDLVMVGGDFKKRDNLNHPELKSMKQFLSSYKDNPKIHMLGFVEDEDLVAIYNLALMTLLVSYYEGFGLSVLESQACGTPVIGGNNSSILEIAGESAVLVSPESSVAISNAIKEILTDNNFRNVLVRKGFENINRFNWEETAKNTLEVYERVLNNEGKV